MVRLNKFLSESGVASRRKSDELIVQLRVMVNGKVIEAPGLSIDPTKDVVTVDGEKIKPQKKVYFLMNKPKGTITSTKDEKGRKTVLNYIKTNYKIFPVGRLDFNTTGLILLSNDGDFANLLLHPRNKIIRTYEVILEKELTEESAKRLLKGIYLDRRKSVFNSLEFPKNSKKFVRVTTVEGRNHFVKRMFEGVGYFVKKLHRSNFGPFNIENLETGSYYQINAKIIDNFIKEIKN